MSETAFIELETSPWMDSNGITTSVFIGDACDPCYESVHTYQELIEKELQAHTVYGKLINDNIGYAEELVIALEEAAAYARARFLELQ